MTNALLLDRKTTTNSTFANMAGEVQIETVVQLINFSASRQFSVPNPPHRKSAKRYQQA